MPVSVLKARFSVFAKAFVDVLATNSDTENPSLLRSVSYLLHYYSRFTKTQFSYFGLGLKLRLLYGIQC